MGRNCTAHDFSFRAFLQSAIPSSSSTSPSSPPQNSFHSASGAAAGQEATGSLAFHGLYTESSSDVRMVSAPIPATISACPIRDGKTKRSRPCSTFLSCIIAQRTSSGSSLGSPMGRPRAIARSRCLVTTLALTCPICSASRDAQSMPIATASPCNSVPYPVSDSRACANVCP